MTGTDEEPDDEARRREQEARREELRRQREARLAEEARAAEEAKQAEEKAKADQETAEREAEAARQAAADAEAKLKAAREATARASAARTSTTVQGAAAGGLLPAVAPIFSPWQAEIDLTTKAGKALWDEGIKPVENKFTGYGKDVIRFLADVKNRATKCHWTNLLQFHGRDLLTQYGEIHLTHVKAARTIRNAAVVNTLREAQPRIQAAMMYHFIYESLGTVPQRKVSTKLDEIEQDGPTLLKVVLDDTFVATKAQAFSINERLFDMHLKNFKWNVQLMNQHVREKMQDLVASGNTSNETILITALFRAYSSATNEEFKNALLYWKNEYNSNAWTRAEALMDKADAKYMELRDLGTWGKRSTKDQQLIALTSKIDAATKKKAKTGGNNDKSTTSWRYDKSLSSGKEYSRNGKTFKWCTGPGHGGIGMWVRHEPGTCTDDPSYQKKDSSKKSEGNSGKFDKTALTSMLKAQGLSEEEVESKVEAVLAVIDS